MIAVGDKYHRNGVTVTVKAVVGQCVDCELVDHTGPYRFFVSRSDFLKLERRSLEAGAVFEPAPMK